MSSFEISISLSDLSYALVLTAAVYQTGRAFKSPNPPPTRDLPKIDTLRYTLPLISLYRFFLLGSGLLQAFFSVVHPVRPSAVCWHPETLSPLLFSWNVYSAVFVVLLGAGSTMRVVSYEQLGENFTFELATPSGLVTGGSYAWVKHPAYLGGLIMIIGMVPLITRFDGAYGCVVPPEWQWPLTVLQGSVMAVVGAVGLPHRIFEEEKMMKASFGKEWEEYSRKTWKMIPGIF